MGFAKGGPLENYKLREEIRDENYGLNNTIFLEPLALKMGYWGLKGRKRNASPVYHAGTLDEIQIHD